MNDWHFANKDRASELAAGGQGEIKVSRLSPAELEEIRRKYPAPAVDKDKTSRPIMWDRHPRK
ncbi:hypothetical protein PSTEL_09600 [Paenibacillus stellifer]|uniref:Uncharacterized protein n=1 Tax=Paenibacillus stellifer TaxID=169760 RepID=A0A089LVP7_9BACL|nr:hypothetical protein [Paenibacillus stellifer]AIQ63303.1 hypothetical protein PSTEL_09600 [Paenibacillus stellifer]